MTRLGGLLMRLFPADFRARYGHELHELLVEYGRDVRRREGWLGFSRLLVFQGTDLLLAAHAERRARRSPVAFVGGSGASAAGGGLPPERGPRGVRRLAGALRSDVGFAWRSLRRTPGFLLVAGLTLALGIGATTAIFTVLYGSLLAPLPYPDPASLVAVWLQSPTLEFDRIDHTTSTYLTFRDEQQAFSEFGAWLPGSATVTGDGDPERIETIGVSDGALRALGARAVVGRIYGPADSEPGAAPKLILSHGFWERRYGADEGIVGETVTFQGTAVEVIGVLSPDFRFVGREPAAYWPIRLDAAEMPTVLSFDYRVVARLAPGVSRERAAAELTGLIPASVERYAWLPEEQLESWNLSANVRPLRDAVVGDVGSLLWVLFGAVSIVLLIACVNVANLCLVRAESRRREVAVRCALGATRWVLARQFVVESVLLGTLAGAAGLLLAYASVPLLLQVTPTSLPRAADIGIDAATVGFCVGVSLLAGLLFSAFPVASFGSPRMSGALKDDDRGSSSGRAGNRLRSVLAVGEVALALILLVGAGLMIRSFVALKSIDPGFRQPQRVLTFRLSLTAGDYPDVDRALLAYREILAAIEGIPGVEHAGATSGLTMEGRSNQNSFIAEGVVPGSDGGVLNGSYKAIAGDYFDAAGIPLLAGRTLSWDDIRERRPVGVVTAHIARHYWGSPQAAVGKRIRHAGDDPWREIIGVVGDVRDDGMRSEPRAVAFWPVVVDDFLGFDTWLRRDMAFVVRVNGDRPMSVLPMVRQAVWATNPNLPLTDVATLESVVDTNLAGTSFTLLLLLIASAVAVALGTIGIYGVIAYAFAQRRREIGIRMALGAAHRDIRTLVLRQGAVVGVTGVLLGTVGSIALARSLESMVYEVGTVDPVTYAAAGLFTGGVAMLASYVPALRAARVDPIRALRQ